MALVFTLVILRQWREFSMVRICVIAGAVLYCSLCVLPVERMMDSYNQRHFPDHSIEENLRQ